MNVSKFIAVSDEQLGEYNKLKEKKRLAAEARKLQDEETAKTLAKVCYFIFGIFLFQFSDFRAFSLRLDCFPAFVSYGTHSHRSSRN
jgi:hypothetical protein